jgi:hypothetical protein
MKNWETTTGFPMSTKKHSQSKSHPFTFSKIVEALRSAFEQYPDKRTGDNVIYSMTDAAMGAFAVFFTQNPRTPWKTIW